MSTNERYRIIILGISTLLIFGCDGTGGGSEEDPTADFEELDISICGAAPETFTLTIDNPYFPLPVGRALTLEGEDDGVSVRVVITVMNWSKR